MNIDDIDDQSDPDDTFNHSIVSYISDDTGVMRVEIDLDKASREGTSEIYDMIFDTVTHLMQQYNECC